ncbi:DUF3243 domain-containing protein [Alkalicoccobacillus plakortidis]|uniref:DUF3243 domain-containing protein n=1 Tax=Alkalicoccobacillus plakortidis TaxID=444060 RepID=A0ABT0XFK2_9BACI|nr:DUF3243 domain-containing protein [Alkalicoccobacillus plakortidis]MCM2674681.1 DUF3243 domain-containing protein [Alkalicoccobacillus plakortidis]
MSVVDNWDHWKEFLNVRLDQAQDQGLSEGVISDVAHQVGEYLAGQVEPKNEQERVLAELWKVADEEEQHAIANMMVKLVDHK